MTTFNHYHIASGAKNQMFTLWFNSYNSEGELLRSSYRKNLSIDFNKALIEAQKYADRLGVRLEILEDEVRPIVYGDDVLRFGRYIDTKIANIPTPYLSWLYKNSLREGSSAITNFVNDELIKRGELVDFEGKFMLKSLKTWIENDRKSDGHHYTQGQKVTLDVNVARIKYIPNSFGYKSPDISVITMFDTAGNKIIYKGTSGTYKTVEGYIEIIRKGDSLTVTGKIEHSEYRGTKQTRIMRPKFVLKQLTTKEEKPQLKMNCVGLYMPC